MRRLSRLLLTTATLLSLLLCLATAALWGRSQFTADQLIGNASATEFTVIPLPGQLVICTDRLGDKPYPPRLIYYGFAPDDARAQVQNMLDYLPSAARPLGGPLTEWHRAGLTYTSLHRSGLSIRLLRLPYWFIIAATTPLPAWRLLTHRLRRRRARAAQGLCPRCGYDLRATPDRCPECGTIPAR